MIESLSTVWNKETNILTRTYPNPNPNQCIFGGSKGTVLVHCTSKVNNSELECLEHFYNGGNKIFFYDVVCHCAMCAVRLTGVCIVIV